MARKILIEDGVWWPSLDDDQEIASKLFNVTGVPMNLFIDRQGRTIFRSTGFSPGDERNYVEMIQALMER